MQRIPDASRAYREAPTESTPPIGLVVLLYDRVIDDMRQAMVCMREQNVEARVEQIHHALLVLQQLQGTLDFGRGREPARQLDCFYSLVRAKLLEAQMRESSEIMQQQIRLMAEVRECWVQAERAERATAPSPKPAILSIHATEEGGPTVEWIV